MSPLKSYFGRINTAAKSIMVGLGITWRYMVRPDEIVTIQYGSKKNSPVERYIPDRHRGIHYLETEKCIMCDMCAKACPVDCIHMEGTRDGDVEFGWQAEKVVLTRFVLDLNKCIFCNLCCEPCPKECIHMGLEFDLAAYSRSNGVKNLLTDKAWDTTVDAENEAASRVTIDELAVEKKKKKAEERAAKKAAKEAAEAEKANDNPEPEEKPDNDEKPTDG